MNTRAHCSCGWSKTLSEFFAGKMVRCPQCGAVVETPRSQVVYQVEVEAQPAPQLGAVPYSYPPYLSWKRPAAPVHQPLLRPLPSATWPAARYTAAQAARQQCVDAGACLLSAIVVLAWLGGLVGVGAATHPLVAGVLGLTTGMIVLRKTDNPSARRTVGGLMVALSVVGLFFGLVLTMKPRTYNCRTTSRPPVTSPSTLQTTDPRLEETRRLIRELQQRPVRQEAESFLNERKLKAPVAPTEQWVKDYLDRVRTTPPPREILPLPGERTWPPAKPDPDDQDEQY